MTREEILQELRDCHDEHVETLCSDDPPACKNRIVALMAAIKIIEHDDEVRRLCIKCHNRKRLNYDGMGPMPTEVFQIASDALGGDLAQLKQLAGEG